MSIDEPLIGREGRTAEGESLAPERQGSPADPARAGEGSPVGPDPAIPGSPQDLPLLRRALTGRDGAGKSLFQSFAVTPQLVTFSTRPGLAFYELYATEGIPQLRGQEADPMLTKKGSFPGPGGTLFRLVLFPPKPPEGAEPDVAGYGHYLKELDEKVPGMAGHFEADVPGMHTSDSLDYGVVVRGEMILELDDGQTVHLCQGDTVVQNGTRHRWRNPLAEPCLMAFVLIGGRRET